MSLSEYMSVKQQQNATLNNQVVDGFFQAGADFIT